MDEKINILKSEIEKHQKHQKHPKLPKSILFGIAGIFFIFLIGVGIYFTSNSNQIKLTITNGSELIKKLELRAENAENAQVQERDSIQYLNNEITKQLDELKVLQTQSDKKDKNIKELNDKVDSLLRIVNTYQRSDIEPVKR